MEEESSYTQTKIFLKANGNKTKQMAKEYTPIRMVLNMRDNGLMIYSMVKEWSPEPIILDLKGITLSVKSTAKVFKIYKSLIFPKEPITITTDPYTQVIGRITILQAG